MIEPAPYTRNLDSVIRSSNACWGPAIFHSDPGGPGHLNRYSIITAFPLLWVDAGNSGGPVDVRLPGSRTLKFSFTHFEDAIDCALRPLLPANPAEMVPGTSGRPFSGGLAGYLAYEFGPHFDRMPQGPACPPMPLLHFGLYSSVYIADHRLRRAWWLNREVVAEYAGAAKDARRALRHWLEPALECSRVQKDEDREPDTFPAARSDDWRLEWEPSLDAAGYRVALRKIQEYLAAGDIYQANLTVRYRRACIADPRELFNALMKHNPAPFGAYLATNGAAILSSSPELFFDLDASGRLETRPIKGTIRSENGWNRADPPSAAHFPPAALSAAAPSSSVSMEAGEALLRSEKDRAEHIMIVDLERNDLGKICETGSVRVDPLLALESCTGLQHLVSSVQGQLRDGLGVSDVLGALFPGGSISGAPKVRALEIIRELEPVPRGVYTGAIGWITPEGEARMNLAIRTLACHGGMVDLHVGGGIVADSDPDAEDAECRLKGAAMARAVAAAESVCLHAPTPS